MGAPDLVLADRLFRDLAEATGAEPGITRDSYGAGEQAAHAIVRREAEAFGLETEADAAGNLYMTLPGEDRGRPAVFIGSHLDSVPHGGNYDGAAGVVAGLEAAATLRRCGRTPPQDVTVMAIRAEESTWFPVSYVGSRAALGRLPAEALDVARADSGRSLERHMADCGLDPAAVRAGRPLLRAERLAAFVEVHIEQGPRLIGDGVPIGLVTGIRGSFRYRKARCLGRYGHSGAVPRGYRQDAVVGAASLVCALDALWRDLEAEGHDLSLTVGQFATDPREHAFSKVAGEVGFAVDARSLGKPTLALVRDRLQELCAEISAQRDVRFELGELSDSEPAPLSAALLERFESLAEDQGIRTLRMPSGAGHDAAVFANAGVPSAMLFIRNAHGSHNPAEAMDLADFGEACRLLAGLIGDGWS